MPSDQGWESKLGTVHQHLRHSAAASGGLLRRDDGTESSIGRTARAGTITRREPQSELAQKTEQPTLLSSLRPMAVANEKRMTPSEYAADPWLSCGIGLLMEPRKGARLPIGDGNPREAAMCVCAQAQR
jgi:hypothetical protein